MPHPAVLEEYTRLNIPTTTIINRDGQLAQPAPAPGRQAEFSPVPLRLAPANGPQDANTQLEQLPAEIQAHFQVDHQGNLIGTLPADEDAPPAAMVEAPTEQPSGHGHRQQHTPPQAALLDVIAASPRTATPPAADQHEAYSILPPP